MFELALYYVMFTLFCHIIAMKVADDILLQFSTDDV